MVSKFVFLLLIFLIPSSQAAVNEINKNIETISESNFLAEIKDSDDKIVKTVTASGYGVSIEAASKNAAENALTEVVGSFIDSETLIKKQKEIRDGVISKTKSIKKDIKDYSQGSIKYFEILDIKQNGSIFNVTARVDVRVEDFRAYIKKLAYGSNKVSKEISTSLFTKAVTSEDNLKNKYEILVKNVLRPIRKAEVYEIEIGDVSSLEDFQTKSNLCVNSPKYLPCTTLYKDWDKNRTFVFPFTITLENNFKENMINTLNNISDKKIDSYNINSHEGFYDAQDKFYNSYDRETDYQISIYSLNNKNKTTYILKDVLKYWTKKFNISPSKLSYYYFSNPSITNAHNKSDGGCENDNSYFNPLLLRFKGENNETLSNIEYSQFACRSAWDYPISIIEPGWISYSSAYGRGKRYMPKLGLLASGQYAASERAIFLKRRYFIVAEFKLDKLKNLRGIEIEYLQNNQ